ncbi:MAG: 6,7-dimethyl-8-ribityllumazine synthase [Myxococcales bacterium]|nr:6,7-dimethyl-8-ribityllumazine synthase [Myxococcales bacterium]
MSQGAPKDEKLDAKGLRFAVVATRWNAEIVEKLLSATLGELKACSGAVGDPYRCDGVFELAPLAARIARKGGIDGIVALGCVIKGETDHYTLLANETTRALGQLALELGTNPRPVALTFGVLAVDDEDQARRRSEKGREFARACVSQALALRAVGD